MGLKAGPVESIQVAEKSVGSDSVTANLVHVL